MELTMTTPPPEIGKLAETLAADVEAFNKGFAMNTEAFNKGFAMNTEAFNKGFAMNYEILQGDCIESMRQLPGAIVQTCVTSPPYFGLRDYQTATWDGGDPECDHETDKTSPTSTLQGGKATQGSAKFFRATCGKCGARRIDNQIGLEETPEAYIAKLVEVFREVRRLLKDDGTLWLNLGDSYNGSGGPGGWADNAQTEA